MAKWITADGVTTEVAPANGKRFTLKELQHYVGGYIEALTLADGRTMWLNEDGKRLDLAFNEIADHMAHQAGIAPWDFVVGNVLIATRAETGDDEDEDKE